MSSPHLVDRRVLSIALDRMRDDPVVLLEGPRSVGKSTLLHEIAAASGGRILDLDDPATRDAVAADPATLISGPEPVCIDEYQKAPIVLDAIKAALNRASAPGRFVLTGSTRHDALPAAAQSLTGRLSRLTVHPLTQAELAGTRPRLLSALFADPGQAVERPRSPATVRNDYIDRMVVGGFPMAIAASTPAARQRWIDNYVALTLERDVAELARLRQGDLLRGLLARLVGQTGQVLNVAKAARDVGLDRATAENYLTLLERVFLLYRLPAWGKTLTSRAAALPKVHVLDTAIAARLLRLTPAKLAALDPTALTELGHLTESFVVGELIAQASWHDEVDTWGHWRTHDGNEVDLVLEGADGGIVAFEVKAAGRVPGESLRGLRKLRDAVGPSFLAGVALYFGERSYTAEDRLHVIPVDRLWAP